MSAIEALHNPHDATGHHVRFYEPNQFIFETVAEFFGTGLRTGQPVLLISTEHHRNGIFRNLSGQGLDAAEAFRSGRLKWLDARETLAEFMVNGMPEEKL